MSGALRLCSYCSANYGTGARVSCLQIEYIVVASVQASDRCLVLEAIIALRTLEI